MAAVVVGGSSMGMQLGKHIVSATGEHPAQVLLTAMRGVAGTGVTSLGDMSGEIAACGRERSRRVSSRRARAPREPHMLTTLLLLAAAPDDVRVALAMLDAYGKVPECTREESIVEGPPGGMDHMHHFEPAKAHPSLKGKIAELLPYLDHWAFPVVQRAANLVCLTGDPAAKPALVKVNARFPCESWSQTVVLATGTNRADCPNDHGLEAIGFDALGKRGVPANDTERAKAWARSISSGDAAAMRQVLLSTLAADAGRRGEARAALRRIDTLDGLALLVRARVEKWERDLVKGRWDADSFAVEALIPSLDAAAAARKVPREELFIRAAGRLNAQSFEELRNAVWDERTLFYAAGRYARSPAGKAVSSGPERAFVDFVNRYTEGADPTEIETESRRLTSLKQAGKRAELEAIAYAPRFQGLDFHRMLAAVYLVQLGGDDAKALDLLDTRPPMTLHDLNAIRAEVKVLADGAGAGPRGDRLRQLFEKYDKHCKMNDCSTTSPR